MSNRNKIQSLHNIFSRYVSIIALVLIFILMNNFVILVHADAWKCGTPLLIEDYPIHQDFNSGQESLFFLAPAAPAQIGKVERFFIHIPETAINATCVAVGTHCYVYVENAQKGKLTEADAKTIAKTFDSTIYPKVHNWIGTEFQPGLDRESRITILFHDVGMNASGKDYGGYFSPTDLNPTLPNSNRRDIVYMDIFQFKERSRHTFYSSLAHEFAHLVNWYQNGGRTDQRWLEEGVASFTEWGVYGNIHNLFVDNYLANPAMSLTTANTVDTYYGAAFMLLLYLYENYGGKSFIKKLAAEDTTGIQAINNSLGQNRHFVDAYLNWGTANWVNNPLRGRLLSYQNLKNRKITAKTARISHHPTTSTSISIDSWGLYYVVLENLPQTLKLTLTPHSDSPLYSNVVYFTPGTNIPIIKPFPSTNNQNINNLEISNLNSDGQLLLVITSAYPQMFRFDSEIGNPENAVDFDALLNLRWDVDPILNRVRPETVSYQAASEIQPIITGKVVGNTLIESNLTANLELKSQIHLSSNYNEIEIENEMAFVTSNWGLEIFRLNPTPSQIGKIVTPGDAQAVTIEGDHVYVADGKSGVHLIDINQITSPRIIKTLAGIRDARDVHLADGMLYILDTFRGLLVYTHQDILNKDNPQPRRDYKTLGTPIKVLTDKDGNVYISDNGEGLTILEQNPLGGFIVKGKIPVLALDFEIQGNYVLIATGDLRIFDIERLLTPRQITRFNTPGYTSSVMFFQGLLYLTDQQSGLHILNVNDLQNPKLVSTINTIGKTHDVVLHYSNIERRSYAYIADGVQGIHTLDVTEPAKPHWINQFNAGGIAYSLDLLDNTENNTIAIANGTSGLKIVEFSDVETGKITHEIRNLNGEYGALCVKIDEQFAYVGTDMGLDIVELTTGNIIRTLSTTNSVWDIEIIDGFAYLCAKSLIIVDIRDPKRSQIVSTRELTGSAYKIDHNQINAYIVSLEGGINIFDITDAANPILISNYPTDGVATNVCLSGESVYVLDAYEGVLKLDGTDPQKLTTLSRYPDTQLPIAAICQDDDLYLLDTNSLQIIDSRSMQLKGRYTKLQYPTDLVAVNSSLLITDLHQLRIFQLDTHQSSLSVEERTQENIYNNNLSLSLHSNQLFQNYPNPFNPETWIPFTLAKDSEVSIYIYDINGHLVFQKNIGLLNSGRNTTYWNGRNLFGEPVANGTYFYNLRTGSFSTTRKMVIKR